MFVRKLTDELIVFRENSKVADRIKPATSPLTFQCIGVYCPKRILYFLITVFVVVTPSFASSSRKYLSKISDSICLEKVTLHTPL